MLASLAVVVAQAADLGHARRIMASVLTIELSGIWWMETMTKLLPSVTRNAWDVLVRAYSPQV